MENDLAPIRFYGPSGQLLSEKIFQGSQVQLTQYYLSCALYSVQRFDSNVKEGKQEYFYENESPKTIEIYRAGALHGETLLYWPNGQIKRKCAFQKGIRHGWDQMWSSEGRLIDEGCYKNAQAVGLHRRFGKEGGLIEEILYLEDARFNIRQWDEQGNLRLDAQWIDPKIYREKVWDRFQNIWIEKEGYWNGKKLVYT
jgi:antitoxin component YwqK of YwqJK toxin-antitoxin module